MRRGAQRQRKAADRRCLLPLRPPRSPPQHPALSCPSLLPRVKTSLFIHRLRLRTRASPARTARRPCTRSLAKTSPPSACPPLKTRSAPSSAATATMRWYADAPLPLCKLAPLERRPMNGGKGGQSTGPADGLRQLCLLHCSVSLCLCACRRHASRQTHAMSLYGHRGEIYHSSGAASDRDPVRYAHARPA